MKHSEKIYTGFADYLCAGDFNQFHRGCFLSGFDGTRTTLFELLGVLLVIRLLVLLTARFELRWPILEYLLELGVVLAVVLPAGWLLKWYDMRFFGFMIAIIASVYLVLYIIGAGKARKDAEFINAQIQMRCTKSEENHDEIQ